MARLPFSIPNLYWLRDVRGLTNTVIARVDDVLGIYSFGAYYRPERTVRMLRVPRGEACSVVPAEV